MHNGTIRDVLLRLVVFGLWACCLHLGTNDAQAQNNAVIAGTITDAQDGSPLIGANVTLRDADSPDIVDGAATNTNGAYRITGLAPGEYLLEVRFIGYERREVPVTLQAGQTTRQDLSLQQEISGLEAVVVSASRRQEKVLDAPASISVIDPEDIQQDVSSSSIEVLRTTTGVDMAQTGIDRREVVLRGFNNAFSGATFVLTDYRQAAVPSLGVNVYSIMPNQSIDLERVEVVRGPGSALYGPGVANGVIHFITKDPFNYPGATVAITGGQRSYFGGQFRAATVVGDRWGLKVTGQYAQADEWELDPNDPADAAEISSYFVYENREDVPDGREVVELEDGSGFQLRRDNDYQKFNVNGLIQYKANETTTISLNGGTSALTGTVQSGIGTLQADGFGYSYGQLRVQSGPFFGQVYLNVNDAGDSYVYGSGDRVFDESIQWNAQAQYDFDLSAIGTQFIVGADADLTSPRTDGRITGRNEGDDAINEYGVYAQSTSALTPELDLTLALRGDYNNIEEKVFLSPRVAFVYKATPQNTLRASFNRAISAPGTNSNFLDIEAQRRNVNGPFDLVFRGLGAADGFTFNDFRQSNEIAFSFPVPGFFKRDFALDALPLFPYYAAVANGVLVPVEGGVRFTDGVAAQLSASGLGPQQQALLANLYGYTASPDNLGRLGALAAGVTGGAVLGIPDDSEQGFSVVEGPVDIEPLQQTTTQTIELGYKGLLQETVLLAVDVYYESKQDFVGPLRVVSPLAYLQGQELGADVGNTLGQLFATSTDGTVQALLGQLQASGLPPEQVAAILAGLVGSGLNNTPTGVVQPDQEILPGGGEPTDVGAFLSYRNFGNVEYYGVDASVQVLVSEQFDIFGNVSFISDDFFDNEELDETDTSLSLALNAPTFKGKGGFNYRFSNGFSFNAAGNYVEGFPVASGPYVGDVESYFLLDAGVGFDFGRQAPSLEGLQFNLTAKNILDNEHRQFVGAPELGLTIFGRLTYTL